MKCKFRICVDALEIPRRDSARVLKMGGETFPRRCVGFELYLLVREKDPVISNLHKKHLRER